MIRKQKAPKSGGVKVTFVLPEDHRHAGHVSVVGDFNDWDPEALVLKKRSNKTYSASVTLPPGERYAFRYRTEDAHWFNDEAADEYEPNSTGGENCILLT